MADEEIVPGLPWPILYLVDSLYLLDSDDPRQGFKQWKTTGIPASSPLSISEVFSQAVSMDYEDLQFAEPDSAGTIAVVLQQNLSKILYRA